MRETACDKTALFVLRMSLPCLLAQSVSVAVDEDMARGEGQKKEICLVLLSLSYLQVILYYHTTTNCYSFQTIV